MWRNKWVRWGLIVLLWLALAPLATTFSYAYMAMGEKPVAWMAIARRQFATYLIWGALLTPIVLWMSSRFTIDKQNWKRVVPLHLLASVLVAGLHALLRATVDPYVYPELHRHISWMMWRAYYLANGYNDLWMYWLVAFSAHVFSYYRKYKDRELKAAQLEFQLAQAQLEALKLQLQPHFLFNTLHSISTLMHRDVEAADRMITQLSDLLRVGLESVGIQEIPLKVELEFLKGYLEIEQTRFQDRLTVVMNVDPAALDSRVPNMLLQPLVENAVRHGVANRAGPGHIEVSARQANGCLRLAVRDDGPGLPSSREPGGEGVGLTNTRARLQCLYGAEHRLSIHNLPAGGLEVELEIPFRKSEEMEDIPRMLTIPLSARPIGREVQ